MSSETLELQDSPVGFERLPALSQVENDWFCEGCGYNLCGQGVRREPRLELLLVRCPECGRFHPVGAAGTTRQVWLQRFSAALLGLWVLLLLAAIGGFVLGHFVTFVATLDGLDDYASWPAHRLRLYEMPEHPEFWLVLGLATAAALMLSFVSMTLPRVAMPHWRWPGCVAYAVVLPLLAAAPLLLILLYDKDEEWFFPYFRLLIGIQIIGGLLGMRAGRPLARVVVRVCLPPRLRGRLGYLWTVDGLEPPWLTRERQAGARA